MAYLESTVLENQQRLKYIYIFKSMTIALKKMIWLQMLTGDESVTFGNAFVGGFSILSNLTEAQQNLGSHSYDSYEFSVKSAD